MTSGNRKSIAFVVGLLLLIWSLMVDDKVLPFLLVVFGAAMVLDAIYESAGGINFPSEHRKAITCLIGLGLVICSFPLTRANGWHGLLGVFVFASGIALLFDALYGAIQESTGEIKLSSEHRKAIACSIGVCLVVCSFLLMRVNGWVMGLFFFVVGISLIQAAFMESAAEAALEKYGHPFQCGRCTDSCLRLHTELKDHHTGRFGWLVKCDLCNREGRDGTSSSDAILLWNGLMAAEFPSRHMRRYADMMLEHNKLGFGGKLALVAFIAFVCFLLYQFVYLLFRNANMFF